MEYCEKYWLPALTPAPGTVAPAGTTLIIPIRMAISQTHFDLNTTNTNAVAIFIKWVLKKIHNTEKCGG